MDASIGSPEKSAGLAAPRSFSRQVARYFSGPECLAPWLLAVGIAVAVTGQVLIQLRINVWQAAFFDALERRAIQAMIEQVVVFGGLAAISIALVVTQLSLKMRLQLGWRRWLTTRIVDTWLSEGRHYVLGFLPGDHANADQRIADDVRVATEAIVDFAAGILSALLMLTCFIGVLWSLSHRVVLPIAGGIPIDGYMVWAALLYGAVGTGLTSLVGRHLADLAAAKLGAEGEYRFCLMRARENSEGIAMMRGEPDERRVLAGLFEALAERWVALRRGTSRVAWLTTAHSLMGIIFPTLVASPMYLAGEMSLGGLMQAVAAMVHVQTALSWFVDNFARISDLRASAARITTLTSVLDDIGGDMAAPETERIVIKQGDTPNLEIAGLEISYPDGNLIISGATATILPGEKVLIEGESGSGKSTLLRAIAGVWPWGSGAIMLPRDGQLMFMPQRPYFQAGSLASALAYPLAPTAFAADAYRVVLERCGLGALVARLQDSERWDQVLSGGDQQRLGFARILLHKPGWVFLDEATSGLDDTGQADMMGLFRDELAGSAVISTGHRPGLEKLHDRTMTLVKGEDVARLERGLRPSRAFRTRRDDAAGGTLLDRLRRLVARAR